ncbi:hypothetical protein GCM10011585_33180 [Edaphobacter dinghuensis]|uniref:Phosphotransferase family enzyme n=1 Tax=Edaphobacter dinghuensis TaxID=1560005 RepID=A0A917M9P3_9BACT|nr:hypothetical protein GCM10011585_33180 [Edaphobacter dinghuensis]
MQSLLDSTGHDQTPFARLGWIDEAVAWLHASTRDRISSKKDIRQYNAGADLALIRIRVEDGSGYWLKATGEPNKHERTITEYLYRECHEYIPRLVASRSDWNAWLMLEEGKMLPSPPYSSIESLTELRQAVTSMCEVQDRSSGVSLDILDAGAFDQATEAMRPRIPEMFDYLDEAMSLAAAMGETRLPTGRIRQLQRVFSDVLDDVEHLYLSEGIIHGDLRWEHILTGTGVAQFIDWSEPYLAYPVISLQQFLDMNRIGSEDVRNLIEEALIQEYCDFWAMFMDRELIEQSLIYMPILSLGSSLLGRGDWFYSDTRYDPLRLANAVKIAFRMDAAAEHPRLREALDDSE